MEGWDCCIGSLAIAVEIYSASCESVQRRQHCKRNVAHTLIDTFGLCDQSPDIFVFGRCNHADISSDVSCNPR